MVAWRDRQGRETPLDLPPRAYASPRLDPAGVRVLLVDQSENDFWMWSSASGAVSRLTSGGTAGNGFRADWTSDGRHILRGVGNSIVLTRADGSGADEVVAQTSSGPMPFGTSPDGLFAPFLVGADLFIVGLRPPREVRPLIQSPAIETGVAFHPNGRWIAYQSTERGPYEVFVRPFPDVNRTRWAISSGGGTRPLWSPRGMNCST
jgi:serine/threonine-protein kinase